MHQRYRGSFAGFFVAAAAGAVFAAGALFVCLGDAAAAEPDQVLVLYNADWRVDQDDSAPGQDSKEVAEYYVARHTDPATGRKPYLLGLTCVHGKGHLNQFRLPEDSQDNYYGLDYIGFEDPPKDYPLLDSRAVDILLTPAEAEKTDLKSVVIAVGKKPEREAATVVFRDGSPVGGRAIVHGPAEKGGCRYQFNARAMESGAVRVWFESKTPDGKPGKGLSLVYQDFNDFIVSKAGRDGIRDDRNYIEDVEGPVKKFLEDPANALADGTLLKDRILHIVACHGLPKAAESMMGIARSAVDSLGDAGDGSSLEQRLMVLYYDVTRIDYVFEPRGNRMQRRMLDRGAKPRFTKFVRALGRGGDGVQRAMICNSLCFTLVGQFNPFRHPAVFREQGGEKVAGMWDKEKYADPANRLLPWDERAEPGMRAEPARLSTPERAAMPREAFLYWSSRIDGPTPEIAKGQVDNAVYGTRHFTTKMGTCYHRIAGPPPIAPSTRLGIDELKELGFTLQPTLNEPPALMARPLIYSAAFGDGPRYLDEGEIVGQDGVLPGGITYAIKSFNRWKQDDDQFGTYFQKMVEAGATVTAGLGAVGGAHITSASWWDDRVLFHFLFRGWDLGEGLMSSTFYLDWVTGFVGDPLYRPELKATVADTTPPALAPPGLKVEVLPARDSYCAILSAVLVQSPAEPEVAETRAEYGKARAPRRSAWSWRFSARPQVILRDLEPGSTCEYSVAFIDAYGNATKVDGKLDVPRGRPSRVRHEEKVEPGAKARAVDAAGGAAEPALRADAGEIEVEFTPKGEKFSIVQLGGLAWTSERLAVGGGTALTHEPLKFEPGRRYHAVARWRRRPLTREVYLVAPDGTEFLAACNNHVPWKTAGLAADGTRAPGDPSAISGTTQWGDAAGEIELHSVRITDNANPAPDKHCHPYIGRFSLDEFNRKKQ